MENQQLIEKAENFIDILPHGSGIDVKWTTKETTNYVYFQNSFHCMNEHGYYDGWQDFTISFDKELLAGNKIEKIAQVFKLVFNGSQYKARKYQLRDYLEDTIFHAIQYTN